MTEIVTFGIIDRKIVILSTVMDIFEISFLEKLIFCLELKIFSLFSYIYYNLMFEVLHAAVGMALLALVFKFKSAFKIVLFLDTRFCLENRKRCAV